MELRIMQNNRAYVETIQRLLNEHAAKVGFSPLSNAVALRLRTGHTHTPSRRIVNNFKRESCTTSKGEGRFKYYPQFFWVCHAAEALIPNPIESPSFAPILLRHRDSFAECSA